MSQRAGTSSALITNSAKQFLAPLGLVQKGKSRTWLADHGWWMAVVEFQPSNWGDGSYLNVGCMWLWNVKSHISFDEGHRREEFHNYVDERQFVTIAERLAHRAALEVSHYRRLFSTIRAVSDYYLENLPAGGWPTFNAAVAHGVSGRIDAAMKLFESQIGKYDLTIQWQKEADADTRLLASEVCDSDRFRGLMLDRIVKTRALQKLRPAASIDL